MSKVFGLWLTITGSCLLSIPAATQAQTGAIAGRVVDTGEDRPIPGAEVALLGAEGEPIADAVSDAQGAFRFESLAPGTYRVRVSTLGRAETTSDVLRIAADSTVQVILRMAAEAVELDALSVEARRRQLNPALEAFYQRAESGRGGAFILREEIDMRHPRFLTDLLATTPSMRVTGGLLVNYRRQCPPLVVIDGMKMNREPKNSRLALKEAYDLVNILHPSVVEGMEIYAGSIGLPPELVGSDSGCGVIAIWTQRGFRNR